MHNQLLIRLTYAIRFEKLQVKEGWVATLKEPPIPTSEANRMNEYPPVGVIRKTIRLIEGVISPHLQANWSPFSGMCERLCSQAFSRTRAVTSRPISRLCQSLEVEVLNYEPS